MKITKQQLQQIIKEELLKERLDEELEVVMELLEKARELLGDYIRAQGGDYHPLSDAADELSSVISAVNSSGGEGAGFGF